MSSESSVAPGLAPEEPNHWRRFLSIWVIASVIGTPLIVLLVGPLLGPSTGSEEAGGQHTIMTVLAAVATPVFMLVVLFIAYSLVYFRQEKGAALEGPAIRGNARVQAVWIVVTSLIVLGLAVYGTYELEDHYGHGSGSGPNPLTVPSGPKLPVQVIAQQWLFTYRYPTYGGVETTHLELPVDQEVEFNVTSLDVIHSFWAYKLGVKADANPGANNIAFVKPTKEESFEVRCAELCGIWHGAMVNPGKVVSATAFNTWIHEQQARLAPATKALPSYSKTYIPEPTRRAE
ncbi:MAG TPA: cytochrome c oxidase subunit II [Solirubrobacteraceae bacterium]|jgi:cytochrome c oxidase subunit 2|nr:cytochrome c oxidase subunit II [Solirubrobacteraceae bacterium]